MSTSYLNSVENIPRKVMMKCIMKIGKICFNLSGDQDDNIDDDHADVDDDVCV